MGGRGQAPGHDGDHGPQDHGFVAGGQALMAGLTAESLRGGLTGYWGNR